MTKDEVLALGAGREMDEAVAKQVMGQTFCPVHLSYFCCGRVQAHYSSDLRAAFVAAERVGLFHDYHLGQYLSGSTWMWSVEKHEATEYEGRCIPTHHVLAMGETAPLVVCRAALLAASQGG